MCGFMTCEGLGSFFWKMIKRMAKMIKIKKGRRGTVLCQLSDKSNLGKNNMKSEDLKTDSLNIHLAIFPGGYCSLI